MALDAIVVGSGPNGLAAALTLAEAGRSVCVYEAADTFGGGCRTAELTRPGFRHDVCATVHALAPVSPFMRELDLETLGVRMAPPEIAFGHPLDGGRAALVHRDVERTVEGLGPDGRRWRRLLAPLIEHADDLFAAILGPQREIPPRASALLRFAAVGAVPASVLARAAFRDEPARALFAGAAAHAMRRLDAPLTSAYAMVLAASAHIGGWPLVEGGSGALVDAMVGRLRSIGAELVSGLRVGSLAELPAARVTLLDIGPAQLLDLAGDRLPARYRGALRRFRYGPGVFKVDYALSAPVPWRDADLRRAGTVHLGGTLAEIAAGERAVAAGRLSERPYVLVVQAGVVDPTRAPAGAHTLWAYCHAPSGSTTDQSAAIEAQIERFAPGFRDTVLARATRTATEYERYDANYVGGDINGGRAGLYQTLLGPVPRWSRYRTPLPGVYLCSASTAPGGGVHGMCGRNAAREALARELA